ncbi:hypothetical protein [Mangrovibacter phragmitis]|uniref:hypothetical protein n=1 Tax=Mangrovibacter phragmitis TaxID=1691903 RepID=UPI003515F5D5
MIRTDQFLISITCFAAFFPWVTLGFLNFGSDIQLYSTLICTLVLPLVFISRLAIRTGFTFTLDKTFYGVLLFIFGCVFSILMILVKDGVSFDSLRGIFPYLTAILWIVFVSLVSRDYKKYILNTIPFAFFIWFIVGLIQLVYNRDFLVSYLNRTVITSDRGVISLGSEPAYFAMACLCFTIIFFMQKKKVLTFLSFFSLIFLTRSSAVIFPLLLSMALYWGIPFIRTSTKSNLRFLSVLFIFLIILLFMLFLLFSYDLGFFSGMDSSSRIAKLFSMFATLDFSGLIMDGSFNIRLTHYAGSLYYFFRDLGMPHGTLMWPEAVTKFSLNSRIFWDTGLNQTTRINSGLGTILFEGGWFGVTIFLGLYLILTANEFSSLKKILILIILFIFFMSVFSIKIPFLYVTIMLYCTNKMGDIAVNTKDVSSLKISS